MDNSKSVKKKRVVTSPSKDIHIFDVLSLDHCKYIIEEAEYIKVMFPTASLNSLGIILRHYGLQTFANKLVEKCIEPTIKKLYNIDTGLKTDNAMIIKYSMHEDTEHRVHKDNSQYTVNICLGTIFKGGDLRFHDGKNSFAVGQTPGCAIVHRGNATHSADPIVEGKRYNLVIWCSTKLQSFPQFTKLPNEIIDLVIQNLDDYGLCSIGSCNKALAAMSKQNRLWEPLFFKYFTSGELWAYIPELSTANNWHPNKISAEDVVSWKSQFLYSYIFGLIFEKQVTPEREPIMYKCAMEPLFLGSMVGKDEPLNTETQKKFKVGRAFAPCHITRFHPKQPKDLLKIAPDLAKHTYKKEEGRFLM